jgi:signal transduction histidine kinase
MLLDAVTHEFKTPLTSIKAGATALLADDSTLPSQRELLTVIDEETDRLNAMITEAILPDGQRSSERWLDRGSFFYTAPGTFGNIARNRLLGPSQFLWDFSTLKDFSILEGHRLQFRFEAFNFLNHPVLGNYGAAWGSNQNNPVPDFGRIRSTAVSMRQIQFGLKYIF